MIYRRLGLERLEPRLVMSASTVDVDPPLLPTETNDTSADGAPIAAALSSANSTSSEPAPDLVAFAMALDAADVKFYGAAWCPVCRAQKELFGDGAQFLPFIEVTNADRTPNQIAIDEDIDSYPTWEFPDGSRLEGLQTLATIAQRSGVAIPMSDQPFFSPIDDTTLQIGAPLHIPIDGYDPNGGQLTYKITSDNPNVSVTLLEGNRSARFSVAGWGTITAQLFEDRVWRATDRVISLAESHFYDDTIFHRVVDNFVIQGGDPTGTGSGGSTLGDFDDQFHPDLVHNRPDLLSFANAGDDTNDSQFFMTDAATRHLDSDHSVFGLITEGSDIRAAINDTAVNNTTQNRPTNPVVLESVEIFEDLENAVFMLKAAPGATGTANITVEVADQDGNTFSRTFQVTVGQDTNNERPFLEDIPTVRSLVNVPATFQIPAHDNEGNGVYFDAAKPETSSVNYTFTVNNDTGMVTVTPPSGFVGTAEFLVGVASRTASGEQGSNFDTQRITLEFLASPAPSAPSDVELLPSFDTGTSNSDNLTNLTTLQFRVSGVTNGATVKLFSQGHEIGSATASGSVVVVTANNQEVLGHGTFDITAKQTVGGVTSDASESLTVNIDTSLPGPFLSEPPLTANVGQLYSFNSENFFEGDVVYSLANALPGMSIDSQTGTVTWTPVLSQSGPNPVQIRARDAAGNVRDQEFIVTVNGAPTLGAIDDRTVVGGEAVSFTATITDPNSSGDTHTFSLDSGAPTGASIDPATGAFTWTTPTGGSQFEFEITVRVTDSGGLTDTETFIVTLESSPILDPISTKVVEEGELLSFTVTADDPNLPDDTLTFTLQGAPSGMEIDEETGQVTWTPAAGTGPDSFEVTVRVTDDLGQFDEQTFTLNVLEENLPPEIDPIQDPSTPEGETLTLDFTADDPNLPNDELTFSLVDGPSAATIDPETGVFTWTPGEADGPGEFDVTVRVTDTSGLSDTFTVHVEVTEVEEPPVLTPIADQEATAGSQFTLSAVATDPDVPAGTLTYSLEVGAPEGAAIDPSTGQFTWTPSDAQAQQEFDITVRVTDSTGQSDTETFTVDVAQRPIAPVLDAIADQAVDEDETLTVNVTATDANLPDDSLTYSLDSGAPAGAAIDPATGQFTWTPGEGDGPGAFDITVRVTDSDGLSDIQSFSVTVNEIDRPPVLQPIGDRLATAALPLMFSAVGTDPDAPAQALQYSLAADAPAGATIDPVTGVFRWTPTVEQRGDVPVTILVTTLGGNGLSSSETFTITVRESTDDAAFAVNLAARTLALPSMTDRFTPPPRQQLQMQLNLPAAPRPRGELPTVDLAIDTFAEIYGGGGSRRTRPQPPNGGEPPTPDESSSTGQGATQASQQETFQINPINLPVEGSDELPKQQFLDVPRDAVDQAIAEWLAEHWA